MDWLRQVIARINTQLSDLSPSQRLSIGLCVVVIVGSFVWLIQWSGDPELVRLLEEPMTSEQIATVRRELPQGSFKISGDAVWVHPNERYKLFWDLQDAGALPADTSVTFSKLIDDDSPFRPESENTFRRRVALQNELATVIASSRLVKTAEVFITDSSDRRINAPNVVPTASVKVTLAAGHALDQGIVRACASLVAGAVPGLAAHNISVVDGETMRRFVVPDPEDTFAQDQLGEKRKQESHYQKKILDQLSYIPGVRVSISVQLDVSSKRTREFQYAQPAVSEETASLTETQSGGRSGEAGVGPNVGQSLAGSPSGARDQVEMSSTKFQDQPMTREITTQQGPYGVTRTTASIGIPYSYVLSVLAKMSETDAEPSQSQIDQQFEVEKRRVGNAVTTIVMATRDEDVTVELYPDLEPAVTLLPDGTLAMGTTVAAASDVQDMLRRFGPQGGLAVLALMGLFILSRIAKRSFADAEAQRMSREKMAAAAREQEGEVFTADAGAVGLATPSEEGMLHAREVDEDLLRSAQLSQQVSQLIDQDPAAVAGMLRRWSEASP